MTDNYPNDWPMWPVNDPRSPVYEGDYDDEDEDDYKAED
jgi:hypothetical protein